MEVSNGMKIAVIGDGGWGTTLSILLFNKGNTVSMWSPFPEYAEVLREERVNTKFLPDVNIPTAIDISSNVAEVLDGAGLVVLAVPSLYMREVAEKVKAHLPADTLVVSAAKGVETDTLMRMSEIILQVLGEVSVTVMSGPTIAYEVVRGIPTTLVAASTVIADAEKVRDIFMSERFRVYTNDDVIGVELGGALKNIIAIACGISDGLGFGANTKAAILTRGLVEITRLGEVMGARRETFGGLSGMGDLVTTCISKHGRNRWLGENIGRGKKLDEVLSETEMVVEGVKTTASATKLSEKYGIDMPITKQIYEVLFGGKDPFKAVNELMIRKPKPEVPSV